MAVKIGDRVRFLNSTGGGIVKNIASGLAYVEDEDGFITPVMLKEAVVVQSGTPEKVPPVSKGLNPMLGSVAAKPTPAPPVAPQPVEEELEPYKETPEGEKLNVVLAFVPVDVKTLTAGPWEAYLINDSNYWLAFNLSVSAPDATKWTEFKADTVDPGTQLFLGEITTENLGSFERILFQSIAFKKDKAYAGKSPVNVEQKLDVTKFFKLHCFKATVYFDELVLSVPLVTDDRSAGAEKMPEAKTIEREMLAKKYSDMRPAARRIKKRNLENDPLAPLVVDLHIAELVDNLRGLTPADMLNRQIDEFRNVMDANLKNKGKKIIFIHGKGEGVLRNALMKELNHRYKGHEVQDASFREYGFGATQVTIR